jgi:hypothetical protein
MSQKRVTRALEEGAPCTRRRLTGTTRHPTSCFCEYQVYSRQCRMLNVMSEVQDAGFEKGRWCGVEVQNQRYRRLKCLRGSGTSAAWGRPGLAASESTLLVRTTAVLRVLHEDGDNPIARQSSENLRSSQDRTASLDVGAVERWMTYGCGFTDTRTTPSGLSSMPIVPA